MDRQVMLTIPDEMYQVAQRIARASRRDVAEVLVEAIDLADTQELPDETLTSSIDREEAAFRRLHPALRRKYLGQYVAIHGGELVDHDTDQVALYLRVKDNFPNRFVWIAPVREKPEEEYVMRSPRLVETAMDQRVL